MTASIQHGRHSWKLSTDSEGYRTYSLTTFVSTSDPLDGPYTVRNCAGLPQPGSWWAFGHDFDDWVWCRWTNETTPLLDGEPCNEWKIVQEFSNKPERDQRCNSTPVTDPLLEPVKISGSFNKYTEEATLDRFGLPIVNSAWEQIRGPQVEFDANRTTVRIEQNVAALQLPLLDALKNCVNDATLWGMPRRCIKLSSITWSRRYYGSCYPYFIRTFEFDVNARIDPATLAVVSGFDRDLLDEGTKVLNGQWDTTSGDFVLKKIAGIFYPSPLNPAHFIQYRDRGGSTGHIVLNGLGLPAGVVVRAGTSLYLSLTGSHTAYDTGDTAKWLKLTTDPTNRPLWSAGSYPQGALVNYRVSAAVIKIFVCTAPRGTRGDPATSLDWLEVVSVQANGTEYNPTTAYGAGDYTGVQADVGPYYLSIVPAAQHAVLDLAKPSKWLKLLTSPTVVPPWTAGTYKQGTLALYGAKPGYTGGVYIVTKAAGTASEPGHDNDWLLIPQLTSQGVYNGTAAYGVGDYVSPSATTTGKIHVEKYDEANFLLLGIPTVLG